MAGKKYTREKYENPNAEGDIAKFVEDMESGKGEDSLDYFKLTKDELEDAISVGTSKGDLLKIFRVSEEEMNKWCVENYRGMRFNEVYEWALLLAQKEYKSYVLTLAQRGNPKALEQAAKFVMDLGNEQTNRVVFVNDIPEGKK